MELSNTAFILNNEFCNKQLMITIGGYIYYMSGTVAVLTNVLPNEQFPWSIFIFIAGKTSLVITSQWRNMNKWAGEA